MNLEAGKYYKTRDGRKAFVGCIVPPAPDGTQDHAYPVAGHVFTRGAWMAARWGDDGRRWRISESPDELVEPWREPRTKEVWVGLYEFPGSIETSQHSSKENARVYGQSVPLTPMLALKRVTLTEGEFDE